MLSRFWKDASGLASDVAGTGKDVPRECSNDENKEALLADEAVRTPEGPPLTQPVGDGASMDFGADATSEASAPMELAAPSADSPDAPADPEFSDAPSIQESDDGNASDADADVAKTALPNVDSRDEVAPVRNPPALGGPRPGSKLKSRGRRLVHPEAKSKTGYSPEQRLLLLDTWRRSGLPAKDFAGLVGVSKHTLYKWRQQFEQQGPAGLCDQPRGPVSGSRVSEVTKRTILMLKESHPEWGCQRISDTLERGPALSASPSTVARVLHEAGYETVDQQTRPHRQQVRRFERARPNQLWQTDLFTFVLKRQNRRVYLVAFLDDHSRYIVSFGLTVSATTTFVIEVLESAVASFGPPEEVLTDNGPQYTNWRGKSRFTKHLEKRGIQQIIARPKRPQTLGKVERFWGTLWRELVESTVFDDLEDARRRIGLYIDYYNLQRTHQGIDGLVPADRFFGNAQEMLRTLKKRVAANTLELARHGVPKQPFYMTGQVDGQPFSVHAEGERIILNRGSESRQEVELTAPRPPEQLPEPLCADGSPVQPESEPALHPPLPPGQSAIDGADPMANDRTNDDTEGHASKTDGDTQEGGVA